MSAAKLARLLVGVVVMAAGAAHAGGPLLLCAPGLYATYPGHTAALNYDGGGTLGTRTKAQADAIVNNAIALWTNVPTATISLTRGADLPVDVTSANVDTYYNAFGDGLNPVIYDTDGSIIDLKLGAGASNGVLGFAGSASNGLCQYTEGRAVINGKIAVSDTTMTVVLSHELGHFIGLDHSQLDSAMGLSTSNYPLMYPIAVRGSVSLADDDISAITSLYPDTNVGSSYGTLQGNFLTAGGTPVLGANIWMKENSTHKVYSVVSDYLAQGTGFFKVLLPPGTYTLHAGAIYSDDPLNGSEFTGGSSVGPYSNDLTDLSFQPPLYSLPDGAGTPINVALGNGSPTQIVITAGCTATADFRVNGTGSVTACGAPPPPAATHLLNISTRGQVLTGGDVMIGGFVVSGATPKTVVVRAIGPSLTAFGVAGALSNPTLQLVRQSDGATLATNDNWGSASNHSAISASGFAPTSAAESAIMMTLDPGAYTALVSGAGGATGVGLVEVYEVDHPEVPMINISTRGHVGSGGNVMIGGFVVTGSSPQTVIIRGTGPSLANFGVTGALANPMLQLVRQSDGATIATNDDWGSASNAAAIGASGFAPGNPLESAILITLDPGAYTAIVSGVGGGTGTGLIEVYTQ